MSYKYILSTIPDAGIVDQTYVRVPASKVGKITSDNDRNFCLIIDINSPEKPDIAIKILPHEIHSKVFEYGQFMIFSKGELHPSVDPSLYDSGNICLYEIYLKCKTVDQALLYRLSL